MKKNKSTNQETPMVVTIPRRSQKTFMLKLRSCDGSSLIMNRFPESASAAIEDKVTGKAITKKPPMDVEKAYIESQYRDVNGKLGIPANAIHASMRGAFREAGLPNMNIIRHSIRILGEIIPFKSHSRPTIRKDCLRNPSTGGRNLTIRTQIDSWELHVPILYDANSLTLEQVINLADLAGFHCGFLDNRPNSGCSGSHGMYEVIRQ